MPKKIFSAWQLKLLACLFMLIDHIGLFLLPQNIELRIIGRISFPLFAFMLANGFRHTSSQSKYLLRLAVFALAFQPIFSYCLQNDTWNIFATMTLGMLSLISLEWCRSRHLLWLGALAVAVLATIGELLPVDYAAYGVLLIVCAHLFFNRPSQLALSWLLLTVAECLYYNNSIQLFSLLALPLLLLYNGKRGYGSKWFFYIFYCLHIPLLWYISTFL